MFGASSSTNIRLAERRVIVKNSIKLYVKFELYIFNKFKCQMKIAMKRFTFRNTSKKRNVFDCVTHE